MKIVLATPLYPPESGGPATYASILVEKLPTTGDEILLVKFSDVRHLPKGMRHIAYIWNVIKAAHRSGADLVFALDPVSTGLPALIASRILGKPFVVKIVGDFAWEQGTQKYGFRVANTLDEFVIQKQVPFGVALSRVVELFVAKSAVKIIVPSEYLKNIVSSWSSLGTGTGKHIELSEKIVVIHNSIELPDFKDIQLPESCSWNKDAPLILSAGRLVPWKGMSLLIDAYAEILKKIPDTQLMIIGDGPERTMLQEKSKQELHDAVIFTGALSHAQVLALLQHATVYVQNSSYEGLSHQLLEALMLGNAVIATDVGGNPELINHNENGLLVPFGDTEKLVEALENMLQDGEMRARLAAHALQMYGETYGQSSANSNSDFQVSSMVSKTRELLASCVHTSAA